MARSLPRLPWVALLAGVVIAPMVLPLNTATEILILAIVAVAANILVGYAGLFSFGQAAIFGAGGYAGGYLMASYDLPLIVPLAAGACTGLVVGTAMGAASVRRAGIYFIMMTFAFNQMIYYVAYSWRDVTGGEDGLAGINRPTSIVPGVQVNLDDPHAFYAAVAILFLICFLAMCRVVESPLGRILVAARDNPRRTASVGYDIHQAQTLAFAISGFFTGMAGVLYGMTYWIMPIDAVHWLNSGYIIFMVLIGGTSSMFGPVIGALIFIFLQDLLSTFWARWPLLFGAVIIAVVLYLQGGVLELFGRLKGLRARPAPARIATGKAEAAAARRTRALDA